MTEKRGTRREQTGTIEDFTDEDMEKFVARCVAESEPRVAYNLLLESRFQTIEVSGFKGAIIGMREPMNSHDKMDSKFVGDKDWHIDEYEQYEYVRKIMKLGYNDLNLCQRLIHAGSEHRKFLRMIHVQVEIKAPRYWWEEMATYKIGTAFNSQSTMHRLLNTKVPITLDDFVPFSEEFEVFFKDIVSKINEFREDYLETKNPELLLKVKKILPEGYLQKRMVDFNYEVIRNICMQRMYHKLPEWKLFIDWAKTLPYAQELIFYKKQEENQHGKI